MKCTALITCFLLNIKQVSNNYRFKNNSPSSSFSIMLEYAGAGGLSTMSAETTVLGSNTTENCTIASFERWFELRT